MEINPLVLNAWMLYNILYTQMELILLGVMHALLSFGQMQTFRGTPSILRVQEQQISRPTAYRGTTVDVCIVGMIGPVVTLPDAHLVGFTMISENETFWSVSVHMGHERI